MTNVSGKRLRVSFSETYPLDRFRSVLAWLRQLGVTCSALILPRQRMKMVFVDDPAIAREIGQRFPGPGLMISETWE